MSTIDFYHYTSEAAADAILSCGGIIRMSASGGPDAHFGQGVYGTKLPPSAGKKVIARNNWQQGWKNREKRGRVDYFFRIRIPVVEVKEFLVGNRHLYLYPADLSLNKYDWECCEM